MLTFLSVSDFFFQARFVLIRRYSLLLTYTHTHLYGWNLCIAGCGHWTVHGSVSLQWC